MMKSALLLCFIVTVENVTGQVWTEFNQAVEATDSRPISVPDPNNPHVGRWTVLDNRGLGELDEASSVTIPNGDGTYEVITVGLNWQVEDAKTYSYNFGTDHIWRSKVYPARPHVLNHMATVSYGRKMYFFGGCYADGLTSTNIAQMLDADTKKWTVLEPMPYATCASMSAVVKNKAYICGGVKNGFATVVDTDNLNKCAVYNLDENKWEESIPLPYGRNHGGAESHGDKLYIFGGRLKPSSRDIDEDALQVYDTVTGTWKTSRDQKPDSPAPIMPGRAGIYRCPYHEKLGEFICVGGEIGSAAMSVDKAARYAQHGITDPGAYYRTDFYNPVTNKWRRGADMPRALGDIYVSIVGNDIYITGGNWRIGKGYQGNPFWRLDFPTIPGEHPYYGFVPRASMEYVSDANMKNFVGYAPNTCLWNTKTELCLQKITYAQPVSATSKVTDTTTAPTTVISSKTTESPVATTTSKAVPTAEQVKTPSPASITTLGIAGVISFISLLLGYVLRN